MSTRKERATRKFRCPGCGKTGARHFEPWLKIYLCTLKEKGQSE